jgi:hypothetical protein
MEVAMPSRGGPFYRFEWVRRHRVAAIPIAATLGAIVGATYGAILYYAFGGSSLTEKLVSDAIVGALFLLGVLWADHRNYVRTKDDRPKDP